MILQNILQNIFIKHQKYYDNINNIFNIEMIKNDLKTMDNTLIDFLFNEVLFVYFFTLNINGFKLIDFNKFDQEIQNINNNIKVNDFDVLLNLLNDQNFCQSCSLLSNGHKVLNLKEIISKFNILKEINTSSKIQENDFLLKYIFVYKSYKTILKSFNINENHDFLLLKEKKYSSFLKDYNSIFYKSISIKKKIEKFIQTHKNTEIKINLSKIYFNFPFLKEILSSDNIPYIVSLDYFFTCVLNIIFIDDLHYDKFIQAIEYILSEIDKPFNFFSFTEDINISIIDLDVLLDEDLKFFKEKVLNKKYTLKNSANYSYTFNNRFGIDGCSLQTFQEIANTLNLKRQRIEQIQKIIILEYNNYSRVSYNALIHIIHKLISNCENLNTSFNLLRKHFSKDEDFYFYLETICNQSLNYIKNLLSPNIDMRIFEEYSLSNKMPFTYEEIYNILEESCLINKQFVNYAIKYLVENKKIKMTQTEEPLYIPLNLSIPTMYSQILISYPEGQEMNETVSDINSTFNITIANRQNMDMDRYRSVYLYGQSIYRHISFFDSTYTEDYISNTLKQIHSFLTLSNNDRNIYQCIEYLKSQNNNINYYDLRYMLKKYGLDFNPSILLAGKSNADIVSLTQSKGKSLKTIIIDFVNKTKDPFTIEDLYQKIHMQHNTVDTTFFNLLKEGQSLSRVDGFHYSKPSLAFSNNTPYIENILIAKINYLLNSNLNKSITIAFLENFLNQSLKLTYHKYWYLSFIRFHKNKFDHVYEFESNVLNINNNNQSLTTIIKNLLINCNYDKKLVEKKVENIVLCTNAEMKSTISSILSKEKINKEIYGKK